MRYFSSKKIVNDLIAKYPDMKLTRRDYGGGQLCIQMPTGRIARNVTEFHKYRRDGLEPMKGVIKPKKLLKRKDVELLKHGENIREILFKFTNGPNRILVGSRRCEDLAKSIMKELNVMIKKIYEDAK